MSVIVVKQEKSLISEPERARRIMLALGLKRIGMVREHKDNNCIRGMINKVRHLVSFEIRG